MSITDLLASLVGSVQESTTSMASPRGQRTRSRSKAFPEEEEVDDLIVSSLFRQISEATGETLEAVYRLIDKPVDDAMNIF